jgi:hypothetical protein
MFLAFAYLIGGRHMSSLAQMIAGRSDVVQQLLNNMFNVVGQVAEGDPFRLPPAAVKRCNRETRRSFRRVFLFKRTAKKANLEYPGP